MQGGQVSTRSTKLNLVDLGLKLSDCAKGSICAILHDRKIAKRNGVRSAVQQIISETEWMRLTEPSTTDVNAVTGCVKGGRAEVVDVSAKASLALSGELGVDWILLYRETTHFIRKLTNVESRTCSAPQVRLNLAVVAVKALQLEREVIEWSTATVNTWIVLRRVDEHGFVFQMSGHEVTITKPHCQHAMVMI